MGDSFFTTEPQPNNQGIPFYLKSCLTDRKTYDVAMSSSNSLDQFLIYSDINKILKDLIIIQGVSGNDMYFDGHNLSPFNCDILGSFKPLLKLISKYSYTAYKISRIFFSRNETTCHYQSIKKLNNLIKERNHVLLAYYKDLSVTDTNEWDNFDDLIQVAQSDLNKHDVKNKINLNKSLLELVVKGGKEAPCRLMAII
jgi:hypothetical protein